MTTEMMTDAEKRASEHYWGGCPECGGNDGSITVRSGYYSECWYICGRHRTKWPVSAKASSAVWWDETRWKQDFDRLSDFTEVEPLRTWTDSDLGAAAVSGMSDEAVEAAIRDLPI